MSLSAPATTLTVVQGAALARTLQGVNLDGTTPTQFLGTDTLTATVWLAQAEASITTPTAAWSNAAACQVAISLTGTQTASLALDTTYNLQVFATRSGTTYCIAWLYLQVLPAAGSQAAASPPDLITGPYAAQLLAQLSLTEAQLEAVPTLITAASDAIRSWCNRRFDQGTVTEELPVVSGGELDGVIRLSRPPINYIQRIQCFPSAALTVANTTANAAWIYPATTGDVASGQTITGLVLNWISGGVTSSSTITYAAGQTINSLATAIGAVGSGWTATADTVLGAWPVTEIIDGLASKGAASGDEPDDGAIFHVYAEDITDSRFVADDGQNTGMVWVGRRWGDSVDWRWGPDAPAWTDAGASDDGRVKVTYNGGYATIPREVQLACVELVKSQLSRLGTEMLIRSETAADYSYTINDSQILALPTPVLQGLVRYRITNA